jgi:hypothetical protein
MNRRIPGLRVLARLFGVAALVVGLGVVVAPSPAMAEPAYYLFEQDRGVVGPCGSALSVGSMAGSIYYGSPSDYKHWSNSSSDVYWEGEYQIWEYTEYAFSAVDYYYACHNYRFVYRYYGNYNLRVHRTVQTKYFCLPDFLSCLYAGTFYSSYSNGW